MKLEDITFKSIQEKYIHDRRITECGEHSELKVDLRCGNCNLRVKKLADDKFSFTGFEGGHIIHFGKTDLLRVEQGIEAWIIRIRKKEPN
jgi:hypothetical protein